MSTDDTNYFNKNCRDLDNNFTEDLYREHEIKRKELEKVNNLSEDIYHIITNNSKDMAVFLFDSKEFSSHQIKEYLKTFDIY